MIATTFAFVSWAVVAAASQLYVDHFDYADGWLAGNGTNPTWYAHSAAATNPILVQGWRAYFQQASGSREDLTKQFSPAQSTSAKTYASFTLVVTALTGTTDDYFAHFKPYPTVADTFNYKGRVYVSPPQSGGNYTVGVSVTSSGTSPVVRWSSDLTYGVRYRIVSSYDAATGTSELWVNPVDESSAKITSTNAAAAGSGIGAYCLRQGSAQTSTEYVDDLYIGTTFADVVSPLAPTVPASGPRGLMLVALLMAGAGTAVVLRRRQATV